MTKANKKFSHWFNMFLAHHDRGLWDVYKKPSSRKKIIWNKYVNMFHATILSYNCQLFTVGYLELIDNKIIFHVETYGGSHEYELIEAEKQLLREARVYGV